MSQYPGLTYIKKKETLKGCAPKIMPKFFAFWVL